MLKRSHFIDSSDKLFPVSFAPTNSAERERNGSSLYHDCGSDMGMEDVELVMVHSKEA